MTGEIPIPIDAGRVSGWQLLSINTHPESLVAIGYGTDYNDIVTSAVYAGEHLHSPYRGDHVIDAAQPTIYIRSSVADRLRRAQTLLPEGMRLIVFDGYRSVDVQRALYDQFLGELRLLKPTWSESQLAQETERYVALPSTGPLCPSPHSTGGAVDVAIVRDDQMIEFGTPFDHGSERSALRYFEDDTHVQNDTDRKARDNRRLLYGVMHEAGFEGFEHEWWHYNAPETQMGARAAGLSSASFGDALELLPQTTFHGVRKVVPAHAEPSALIDRIAPQGS